MWHVQNKLATRYFVLSPRLCAQNLRLRAHIFSLLYSVLLILMKFCFSGSKHYVFVSYLRGSQYLCNSEVAYLDLHLFLSLPSFSPDQLGLEGERSIFYVLSFLAFKPMMIESFLTSNNKDIKGNKWSLCF